MGSHGDHGNQKIMKEIGIDGELRASFLNHSYYSPRNQTIIVAALEAMNNTKGRQNFIAQAIHVQSEIDAFTFQQIAELLVKYHRQISPIVEIFIYKGIPVGLAENGSMILSFPVDWGRWNPFSEMLLGEFADFQNDSDKVIRRELWITGMFTPRTKHHLTDLGVSFTENIDRGNAWME